MFPDPWSIQKNHFQVGMLKKFIESIEKVKSKALN